jgi:hypothetical protein
LSGNCLPALQKAEWATSTTLAARPTGHITGVGGVFVTSKDPKALANWYRDVLGIKLEPWGGAILRYDAPGHPPMALWNAMPESSKASGVTILKRQADQTGKFASILDPDGTKIEFWQPPAK